MENITNNSNTNSASQKEESKSSTKGAHHVLIIPNDIGIGVGGVFSSTWIVEKRDESISKGESTNTTREAKK